MGEQPRDQQLHRPLELRARRGVRQLELDGYLLKGVARPQGAVAPAGELQGTQTQLPEAVRDRIPRQRREPAERLDAEALELVGQVLGRGVARAGLGAGAARPAGVRQPPGEEGHGEGGEESPRLAVGDDHRRRLGSGGRGGRRRGIGAEADRGGGEDDRDAGRPAAAVEHALDPAPQAAQPAGLEEGLAGALGLDLGADPGLEAAEGSLPGPLGLLGVRRDQRELGAARERLAQPHAGADAEPLGRSRHLADQLGRAGLGGKRRRPARHLPAALAQRDQEPESGG
jgi:hypothetical protein